MTTPTDYPDRVRALLEAATPGPWQVMPDARARVKLDHVESGYGSPAGMGSPVCSIPRARAGDAELCAEAPTLARAYLDLHAEVERLTRVLAVECGDVTQVRPGWRRENNLEWSGPGERWVYRSAPGRWIWASGPTVRGEARTAYEAMEAADRAAGGAA